MQNRLLHRAFEAEAAGIDLVLGQPAQCLRTSRQHVSEVDNLKARVPSERYHSLRGLRAHKVWKTAERVGIVVGAGRASRVKHARKLRNQQNDTQVKKTRWETLLKFLCAGKVARITY